MRRLQVLHDPRMPLGQLQQLGPRQAQPLRAPVRDPALVRFDPVQAVRAWKATGKAPDQIVVETSGEGWPTRKRLVCAYPAVSTYKGRGDVGDPANFTCR